MTRDEFIQRAVISMANGEVTVDGIITNVKADNMTHSAIRLADQLERSLSPQIWE